MELRGQSCCMIDKLGLRPDPPLASFAHATTMNLWNTSTPIFTRGLDHNQALNSAAAY